MADNYWLNSAQGSLFNLGSYLDLNDAKGPDFGDGFLVAHFNETPAAEGGRLGFTTRGVRKMSFPLILSGNASTLPRLETQVKTAADQGGFIDLQPAGVPTAEMIRFDVAAPGRWKPAYAVREHGIGVRRGTLEIDVQPFGFWPTEIILASAASVGMPGQLAIPNASIIGDVPGAVHLTLRATGAGTAYPASGPAHWRPDAMVWSLSARPSFQGYWRAASLASGMVGYVAATLVGDQFAPGSQAVEQVLAGVGSWRVVAGIKVPTALEPAYRGRHRLFAYAKLAPSQALPWMLTADVHHEYLGNLVYLASAGPIATLPPAVSSTAAGTIGAFGAQPSPAYCVVDLGEITLPELASGLPQQAAIRIWTKTATTNIGVSTPYIRLAGLYLQPLEGPAGVLPRGLRVPGPGDGGALDIDAYTTRNLVYDISSTEGGASRPRLDADIFYRGLRPYVGASTVQLDISGGGRTDGDFQLFTTTDPLVHSSPFHAQVGVSYRPRFSFQRGL